MRIIHLAKTVGWGGGWGGGMGGEGGGMGDAKLEMTGDPCGAYGHPVCKNIFHTL